MSSYVYCIEILHEFENYLNSISLDKIFILTNCRRLNHRVQKDDYVKKKNFGISPFDLNLEFTITFVKCIQ